MSLRRFPLFPLFFFAFWALWFALPPTREAVIRQRYSLIQSSDPPSTIRFDGGSSRDEAFMATIFRQSSLFASSDSQSWEQFGARFPDDAAICAAQIVFSSGNLVLARTRHPGPSSDNSDNSSVKRVSLPPISTVPPTTLKSWFAATARGAKLEPHNAFWDWAKIIGLLAARRDAEVWPVLHAANTKTLYEDHVSDIYLTRLRVLKKRYGASFPPLAQLDLPHIGLKHFSTMEEAAHQINDNAIGLRLSGVPQNQKIALEGMRDLMLLSRTIRRNAKTPPAFFTGQELETVGLYGGTTSPYVTSKKLLFFGKPVSPPLSTYTSDTQSLFFFARKLGRNDISSQLQRDWVELAAWNRLARVPSTQTMFVGLDTRDIALAQMGEWLGTLLLAGLPSLLVVAILSSIALRLLPAWRRQPDSYPSLATPVGGLSLTVVSLLVLSLSALWAIWRAYALGYTGPLLFEVVSIFGEPYGVRSIPPKWLFHFPAILTVLFSLAVAAGWESRRQGVPPLAARLRRMGTAPEDGLTRFDLSPLLALIGSVAGSCLCIAAMLAFLILPRQKFNLHFLHTDLYAIPILILTTIYLALPLLWRLRTAPSWAFAFATIRRFAWSQLVFLSLLWGILWLLAAPAQKRFDAALTHQIQVGEFQLMRQQLGL